MHGAYIDLYCSISALIGINLIWIICTGINQLIRQIPYLNNADVTFQFETAAAAAVKLSNCFHP